MLSVTTICCIACHGILDVSDPTLIRDSDIANAGGANGERLRASEVFLKSMTDVARDVALFTDEWTTDVGNFQNFGAYTDLSLDVRASQAIEDLTDSHLGELSNSLWQTSVAIPAIRSYTPDSLKGDFLGQLFAIRGYVILQMAEDICPGFPVNDVIDNQTQYGGPLTTDSALTLAGIQLDSAIKYARDSSRFITLARVAKGRVLLDQGKFADAASVVATVPTESLYSTSAGQSITTSTEYCDGCILVVLGNREGVNGLPFASANDPRIPAHVFGVRQADATDTLYTTTKGTDPQDRIILASGIEARLIQAEAALHEGQDWKSILDNLRLSIGLDPLVDPGTPNSRIDLIFRERAFWLFMSGRRLGDMHRLVKLYNRSAEDVFPTGTWRSSVGVNYETATFIPFQFETQHQFNPHITSGCSAR